MYHSLNGYAADVDFREAALRGQAPDKGLYFPRMIPVLAGEFLRDIERLSDEEIAFRVIQPYVGDCIDDNRLYSIVAATIGFPLPLVRINENVYSLELFHGPTLAFKDVGARFMSRCLSEFIRQGHVPSGRIIVLVATSGDTGGAVANGFLDAEGIEVIILFPKGKVSLVQELQLTSAGRNIHALEVEGSFDDCQAMVKEAFLDEDIRSRGFMTSANSINVARWLPQQFYYFMAWKQWEDKEHPPVIVVPSGNFGNICAGLLASQSGLPFSKFLAATNANDVIPRFIQTGNYRPQPALATWSNAMDVGSPSNFIRILELFGHDRMRLSETLQSVAVTDEETLSTISEVYLQYEYLLDPHAAVGYAAFQKYRRYQQAERGIVLETAHPVKFPDPVERSIGKSVPLPVSIEALKQRPRHCTSISSRFSDLKDFLMDF